MQMQVCWVNAESKKGIQSEFHFYIPRTCCWSQIFGWCHYQLTIRQQMTSQNLIILINGECTCKSAESTLSQKRGYKVNSISTYLGLVVDVKKIIQIITNRLLDNKESTKFRLFYWITITDTCLLSQCWVKKGDTKWISFLHS